MRRLVAAFLLLLMLTSAFQVLSVNSASPSSPSSSWWNAQYAFRREVTFTNPTSQPMANQPIVLHLSFGPSEVYEAASDLRLVNASTATQSEVPSYVLSSQYTGLYVSSATLLFFATLKPSSSVTLELYYGSPTARVPSYRPTALTRGVTNGLISFDGSVPRPGSSRFILTYGNTYSEAFLSKIFIGAVPQGYGSIEVSGIPYSNNTGWSVVANNPALSVQVVSEEVSAGGIDLTTAVVLYKDHASILNLESGAGAQAGPAARYVEVINSSSLSTLGQVASGYDAKSGSFSSSVAGASVGFETGAVPSGYDVGNSSYVITEALSGAFMSRTVAYGDTSGVFSWNLAPVQAGVLNSLIFGWLVGTIAGQVQTGSGSLQLVQAQTGREVVQNSFLPKGITIWSASIPLSNILVGTSGIQFPLTIYGASWLPATVHVQGTLFYRFPEQTFAQSNAGWTTSSGSTGISNAQASTTFYSLDRGGNVARLSISSYSSNSTGYAGLASVPIAVSGNPSPTVNINYEASLAATQGLPSNQTAFAAIDISSGLTGTVSKTVYFPFAGSSTSINPLSCGAMKVAPPLPTKTTPVIQAGSLIADGTWRSLTINLATWDQSSQFVAKLRFCLATTNAFVGSAQLLLSSANVAAQGKTGSLLVGSLSYTKPLLSIGFNPASGLSLPSENFNGTATFTIETVSPTNSVNGTAFTGAIHVPRIEINSTKNFPSTPISILPVDLVFQTPFSGSVKDLELGQTIRGTTTQGYVVYSDQLNLPTQLGNGSKSYAFNLAFHSTPITVAVTDADGKPVPGANVDFLPQGTTTPAVRGVADPTGALNTEVLPWNYQVRVVFDGVMVWNSTEAINGTKTLDLSPNINEMSVLVVDSLHHAMQGAQVYVSLGNSSKTGITDQGGVYSFQAAANQVYHVLVSTGSSQVYSGSFKATPNNSQIQISTSYYPYSETLQIGVVAAAMIISVTLLLYLALRRRRTR